MLSGVFDYAGLFPPATLTMPAATADFGQLRLGEHQWMTRRFVCPLNWLDDLIESLPAAVDEPWSIAVLGTSIDGFRQDIALIEKFEEAAQGRALVEAYEVKALPKDITKSAIRHIADAGFEEAYAELAWGEGLVEGLQQLVQEEGLGVKVRTGGLEASAFPSSAEFAAFIREAISLDLQFKCTAGLHHAMPFHDAKIGTRHHGFLNVLMGTAVAACHDLSTAEIQRILECEDASAFWFSDLGAGFRDWELSLDDIVEGREFMRSIGSCSIAEPVETLAELGYHLETTRR